MAQEFLDGPEVRLTLQQMGGEAVAQAVGRQAWRDSREPDPLGHHPGHPLGGQAASPEIEEQGGFVDGPMLRQVPQAQGQIGR